MAEIKSLIDGVREVLKEIGEKDKDLVVVSGDLIKSTGLDKFQEKFQDRCINIGVAEEDLISFSAGLSGTGLQRKPVIATSFACFGVYLGFGQIIQSICLNNAPVKMIFTHLGLNVGADGASHQATIAMAMMRLLPKMKVAMPADYYETKAVIREALKVPGPVCIFLPREPGEVIYDKKIEFRFGESKIHRYGEEPRVLIIACGLMVNESIKAAEILKKEGLLTTVVNASSIKPFDSKTVLELSQLVEWIFTVEEQSILGGLGGIVCETLGEERNHPPITRLGIPDEFGQSGKAHELWDFYGLTGEKIVEIVLKKFGK